MDEIINPLDALLDENNNDNIVLYAEDDEATEFEQVAVIPMEDALYCILRPVDMPEIEDDVAFVFAITGEGEEASLDLVEDDEIIDAVFEIYYSLFDEEEE